MGRIRMQVLALVTDAEVHWRCIAGPDEWIGTELRFELSMEDQYTIVRFAHLHWREVVEFTAHCSTKWAVFLLSLKQLAETGVGRPSPTDLKIDNWN